MDHSVDPRWGLELWDCLDQVLGEVAINNSFLLNTCSKYIRERAEVEREYARNLRRLSSKYSSVNNHGFTEKEDEQRQIIQSFKAVMIELGYQAGQHELLADELQKKYPPEIKNSIKDILKVVDNIKKELKCQQSSLEKSYKVLEKSKSKYSKVQDDFNSSKETFSKLISTEINDRTKQDFQHKEQQVEDQKIEYAVQLVQTNKCQSEYYECELPATLDRIQKICEGQSLYFASVMIRCVENEMGVFPIIAKCHHDMKTLMENIDIKKEMNMIIERYKTGAVPPAEIQFNDLSTPGLLSGIQSYTEPLQLKAQTESGKSLYQEKRQIEKKIKVQEEQIQKGIKEILALKKMVQTYQANPKFGSTDKLCEQLELSVQRVEVLKSGVMLLRGELERVLSKLEIIKMSNETYYFSNYGSIAGSKTPEVNDIYHTTATAPSSSDLSSKEYESIDKILPSNKKYNFYGYSDDDEIDEIYQRSSSFVEEDQYKSLQEMESYKSKVYDWVTQCRSSPSPPPPPLPSEPPIQILSKVAALYPFIGEVENSINMEEGEEFYVTEPDIEGWTRVRRIPDHQRTKDEKIEGFVPSSFIKFLP